MTRGKRLRRAVGWLLAAAALYLLLGATLPLMHHAPTAEALPEDFLAAECLQPGKAAEQVACIEDNEQALQLRLQMIRSAQREILFSTFELKDDATGRAVMAALTDAAERGVQVRVLVDGFNALLNLTGSRWWHALAAEPGIQVRQYAPVDLLRPWRIQTRLHDKYLVVDDSVYLLGGRNTYDRFLTNASGASIDRELLVWQRQAGADGSLQQLRRYFESVWALEECRPYTCRSTRQTQQTAEELHALAQKQMLSADTPDWAALTLPANRITLLSNPIQAENKTPALWAQLCALMQGAPEVLIQTPYAICSREMYADLEALRQAGGQISVLTNSVQTGANLFGCVDYLNQKQTLLQHGLTLYEYAGERSSHTKTVLIGDRLSVVGSFNLDMRSAYLDTELMLAVDCPALNAQLRAAAAQLQAASLCVQPDGTATAGPLYAPPALPLGRRLLYAVMRVVSRPIRFLL